MCKEQTNRLLALEIQLRQRDATEALATVRTEESWPCTNVR